MITNANITSKFFQPDKLKPVETSAIQQDESCSSRRRPRIFEPIEEKLADQCME